MTFRITSVFRFGAGEGNRKLEFPKGIREGLLAEGGSTQRRVAEDTAVARLQGQAPVSAWTSTTGAGAHTWGTCSMLSSLGSFRLSILKPGWKTGG